MSSLNLKLKLKIEVKQRYVLLNIKMQELIIKIQKVEVLGNSKDNSIQLLNILKVAGAASRE